MRKFIFVAVLSMFLLSACSSQQKYTSVNEAVKSIEHNISQIESTVETHLDGIQPISYELVNNEFIRVYDFGSKEKRDLGNKHFEEKIQLLSSHAPIVYQSGNYLVLYYSNVNSTSRTPKLTETKYGEKIQKALNIIE
ncbi:membrane lipoprotein lipid attachment site-containing protein [Paenibacillus andongensis]|uniref:membrane lipoprotein lipid attachment site-containing protein n=1 Tax=Paenibacillus andongensis TaxID=2975482 RepID=UPI0021BB5FD5|nr:membrane lipoprotein lipid attachment site-containing protein [Paenibacillus andongensis]